MFDKDGGVGKLQSYLSSFGEATGISIRGRAFQLKGPDDLGSAAQPGSLKRKGDV